MTITQLKYILSVAEHRNFTLASNHSFVSQPTLSMQVQKLEEELGVIVFDRTKKPIRITDIGSKVLEQARVIVSESNRLYDVVQREKNTAEGDLKIGIIPTVMPTLLPMFLKSFNKKHPKIRLIVLEMNTSEIIESLNKGHIDIALAATPLEEDNITERPIYKEPFMGLIPESHRLSSRDNINVNDLDINDLLLLEDGHCFKDNILNLCKMSKSNTNRNFRLESGSFETLIELSKQGLGMTLLPYLQTLTLSEKDKLLLKEFTKPIPAREISLIYNKEQLKMQLVEVLEKHLKSVIKGAITFEDLNILSPIIKM